MKRAKSRIFSLLSLILAVVVMLTFVGCGKDVPPSADATDGQTVVTTIATTSTTISQTKASDGTTATTEAASTTGTITAATEKPATTTTTRLVPPTDGDPVPDKLDGQKIQMFTWWNATDSDLEQATYFKKHTGIQVSFETCSLGEYQSQLSAKMMANNAPALAAIRSEWYPLPITRGLMQPIANTGWDFSNQKDDIYALDLMDQFAYKGEHYGVALKGSHMSNFQVMFFNKDLLKANGVEEDPYELWKQGRWNWDTCLSIAKRCTDVKKDRYGVTTLAYYYWMLSADQDLVLSEADGLKNNAKAPEVLDTWMHALNLMITHHVTPVSFMEQDQLFYRGIAAMLGTDSDWMKTDADGMDTVSKNVTFDWGVVPFPSPADGSAVTACQGVVWGFPAKISGNELQAAMWWLRYYLDDSAYGNADVYTKNECWEVMRWMSSGQVRSFNSVSAVCYGGECDPKKVDHRILLNVLTDEGTNRYRMILQNKLGSLHYTLEQNIPKIENEL